MFCKNCGKKLENDEKFCGDCGRKVTHQESVGEGNPASQTGARSKENNSKNQEIKSESSGIKALGIILVLALVGFIIYGVWAASSTPAPFTSPDTSASSTTVATTQIGGATNQPAQPQSQHSAPNSPKSVAQIVSEWQNSTAYVDCTFGSIPGGNYEEVWGSGLLVMMNSVPTVITNRHVVDNGQNNFDSCYIKFPSTINSVGYLISPALDNQQEISYASDGSDVAYITFSQNDLVLSKQKDWDKYSLYQRAKSGTYLCQSQPAIGDPVVILGYPVDGSVSSANYYTGNIEVTATEGIISGQDGIYYTTSAKVDHGNSGGLAIDQNNDCYFGIPTWAESGGFTSLARILPASSFLHY